MITRQASRILLGVVFALSMSAVDAQDSSIVPVNRATGVVSRVHARRSDRVDLVNGQVSGAIQTVDTTGLVSNLPNLTISFYRNGALAAQVLTGADGAFTASLSPGFYTLVAYGPSGYCTYGVEAVERGRPNEPPAEAQSVVRIESLAVPPSDFSAVYMLSRRYAGRSTVGPIPTLADRSSASDLEPLSESGAPETSLYSRLINTDADGSVPGMLNLRRTSPRGDEPGRMNAFLVRNGTVVKQATVAADGSFRLPRVAPGRYSFVGAGADGFLAFSVVIASPAGNQASR